MDFHLRDPEATDAFAACLARTQPGAAVVWLAGDLGAGKSAFARAFLRSKGVQGPIKSPTYTIVESYDLPSGGHAAHLDLYRLGGADDLEYLGLPAVDTLAVVLIEWPERGARALGSADIELVFEVEGKGRHVRAQPRSALGQAWLNAVKNMWPA